MSKRIITAQPNETLLEDCSAVEGAILARMKAPPAG